MESYKYYLFMWLGKLEIHSLEEVTFDLDHKRRSLLCLRSRDEEFYNFDIIDGTYSLPNPTGQRKLRDLNSAKQSKSSSADYFMIVNLAMH